MNVSEDCEIGDEEQIVKEFNLCELFVWFMSMVAARKAVFAVYGVGVVFVPVGSRQIAMVVYMIVSQ